MGWVTKDDHFVDQSQPSNALYESIFNELMYERDGRNPPNYHRFAQFKRGWLNATSKNPKYRDQTFNKYLTWNNLGYRLGTKLSYLDDVYIEEIYNFFAEKYKELLTAYLPKVIRTEAENEQALAIVENLMHRKRSPEENELYQLLITLIEKFEQEYYQPNQQNNPQSMLLFLLEQSDKTEADLQAVLGSETLVDNILNGNQKINPELTQKLADFFDMEASIFHE